jgi:TRAP-type mannitol/chloroaromatic compound transport system permease small subunit
MVFATALTTFLTVIFRYVFDLGWVWLQELVLYFHAFSFLLGMGWVLLRNEHVRVDVVYRKLTPSRRIWVDRIGTVLFLFPMCGLILWKAFPYVWQSWQFLEGSSQAGGIPAVFLLKTLLLIFPLLLIVQGIAALLRSGSPYGEEHDE